MAELNAVKIISQHLKDRVVGPGAQKNIWHTDDLKEEFISGKPNDVYICGKLYPKENTSNVESVATATFTPIDYSLQVEVDDDYPLFAMNNVHEMDEEVEDAEAVEGAEEANEHNSRGNIDSTNAPVDWSSRFYPSDFGCTFCVQGNDRLKLSFEYGKYHRSSWTDMKLKISKLDYEYLKSERSKAGLDNLDNWFDYNEGILTWKSSLDRDKIAEFNLFPKLDDDKKNKGAKILHIIEPMCLLENFYKRTHHMSEVEVDLANLEDKISLDENSDIFVRRYEINDMVYVKVTVQHKKSCAPDGKRSFSDFLYQTKLTIENLSGKFVPYSEYVTNSIDEEYDINQYMYRDEHSFGIGDACAVEWSDDCRKLWTTANPEADVKRFSTRIDGSDNYKDVFSLYNLSIWSEKNKESVVAGLRSFIDAYDKWCDKEKNNNVTDALTHKKITDKQGNVLDRLKDSVEYLSENDEAYRCFQLANTAMLMQMIVARDSNYKKSRDYEEFANNQTLFTEIGEFQSKGGQKDSNGEWIYSYYPFQLAFMLLNLKPTIDENHGAKDVVDLIWFPTGGGKTEAYLALTALTIIARRRRHYNYQTGVYDNSGDGVTVIMRYTLRLLTAQQFERAAYLICALQFLRTRVFEGKNGMPAIPGGDITAGMWLGGSVTPNRVNDLRNDNRNRNKYTAFLQSLQNDIPQSNPFPVAYCPWCGCNLISENKQQRRGGDNRLSGYENGGTIKCINESCAFTDGLPLYYIDEILYKKKPTLLFGTVDKFVQLSRNSDTRELFANREKPNLIIQDELHLISGALGTATGLFEDALDMIFSQDGHKTKIVASTATTRNTGLLIKRLYNRQSCVFPAQGTSYKDNFFSKVDEGNSLRHHIGFMPTGVSGPIAEVAFMANMLVARIEYFKQYLKEENVQVLKNNEVDYKAVYDCLTNNGSLKKEIDDYWTILSYYNSIKDVSRTASRIANDIHNRVRTLANYDSYSLVLSFVLSQFYNRTSEFTSRLDSHKIKSLLTKSENRVKCSMGEQVPYISEGNDIILATNMISVGLDISRFNIMYMVGQPRMVAEYIQSSSRVARKEKGLVVNVLSPMRIREKSIFEDYTAFHNVYYKYVEPLSITPYTIAAIDKLIHNVVNCYIYQCLGTTHQRLRNSGDETYIYNQLSHIVERLQENCESDVVKDYIETQVRHIAQEISNDVNFNDQMMNALRDIDPNIFYEIR